LIIRLLLYSERDVYLGEANKLGPPPNQGLLDTSVNVLWIDTSNPGLLLVGTEFGGLFRSTDAGATWTSVLSDASVSAIVNVTESIVAGTAAGFGFSSNGGIPGLSSSAPLRVDAAWP
jgi:hypothetical protein